MARYDWGKCPAGPVQQVAENGIVAPSGLLRIQRSGTSTVPDWVKRYFCIITVPRSPSRVL